MVQLVQGRQDGNGGVDPSGGADVTHGANGFMRRGRGGPMIVIQRWRALFFFWSLANGTFEYLAKSTGQASVRGDGTFGCQRGKPPCGASLPGGEPPCNRTLITVARWKERAL